MLVLSVLKKGLKKENALHQQLHFFQRFAKKMKKIAN